MKYSVVIPVYNVEKTLRGCVASALAAVGQDSEIILVDDCSPDGSGRLCDELADEDGRVRVIHKEKNEGLGFARNTGLAACRGDFVIFCDSDDEFTPDLTEKEEKRLAPDTDILVFGVQNVYLDADDREEWTETLTAEEFSGTGGKAAAEAFMRLGEARIFPFAWNKIYRREFLTENGLLFESTRLIEDFLFNIAAFGRAEKIVISPDCHYRYTRPQRETLVSSYCPEFFELCKRKYGLERAFLVDKDSLTDEAKALTDTAYVKHLLSVMIRNRSPKANLGAKEQRRLIKEMLADETTVSVLAEYRPEGKKMRLVALPMRRKMTLACYLIAAAADKAQKKSSRLFKTVLRK